MQSRYDVILCNDCAETGVQAPSRVYDAGRDMVPPYRQHAHATRTRQDLETMTLTLSDDKLATRIRDCVLELLIERGPGRSICPSEVARALSVRMGGRWQDLMRPVRTVAAALAEAGAIDVLQHDAIVDIREVRGPVRLRLRSLHGYRSSHAA